MGCLRSSYGSTSQTSRFGRTCDHTDQTDVTTNNQDPYEPKFIPALEASAFHERDRLSEGKVEENGRQVSTK